MERWRGRVAVVTGASSGIGAAIAMDLAKAGMQVVALARRDLRLVSVRSELPDEVRGNFHPLNCDVTDEESVKRVFKWIGEQMGGVHVLVNNAGIGRRTELLAANNGVPIREIVDTNIMGVVYCTREAFQLMQRFQINDAHIIVINSVLGHQTPALAAELPSLNIYPATKHAITSMVEVYRQEFLRNKTQIRITSISPGLVDTEMIEELIDEQVRPHLPKLNAADISNAVLYALAAPAHVQVHEIIIKPVGEIT